MGWPAPSKHLLRAARRAVGRHVLHVDRAAAAPADDESAVGQGRDRRHGGVAGGAGIQHVFDAGAAARLHHAVGDPAGPAVVHGIGHGEAPARQRAHGRLPLHRSVAIRGQSEIGAERGTGCIVQLRAQSRSAGPHGDEAAGRQRRQRGAGRVAGIRAADMDFRREAGQVARAALLHAVGQRARDPGIRQRRAAGVDLVTVVVVDGGRRAAAGRQQRRIGDHQACAGVDVRIVGDREQARRGLAVDHPASAGQRSGIDRLQHVDHVAARHGRKQRAVAAGQADRLAVGHHEGFLRDDAAVGQAVVDVEAVRRTVARCTVLDAPQRAGRLDIGTLAVERQRIGAPGPAGILAELQVAARKGLALRAGGVEGDCADWRGTGRRGPGIGPGVAGPARADVDDGGGSAHGGVPDRSCRRAGSTA